jgi:hypothetical protein
MRTIMLAAVAALTTTPVHAGEVFGGLFAHDVTFIGDTIGVGAAGVEDGVDLHLGYRTGKIEAMRLIGRPAVYGFVSVNSENTSNYGGVGLGWTVPLGSRFYLQPGVGIVYTDGEDELPDFREPGISPAEAQRRAALRAERIEFGSKLLFEPELAIGYRLTERVAAELAYVHISNGRIIGDSDQNDGMDTVGVRITYKLGGS